jgi:Holliday junction resolvase RusA-like endonuclease
VEVVYMVERDPCLFWCRISGVPVPQGRPRIKTKPFPGVYYSAKSQAYRKHLVTVLQGAYSGPPISERVWVTVKYAGARKGSDADNVLKQCLDACVQAGVLADDCQEIVAKKTVWCMDDAPGAPFAEIVVETMA